MTRRIERLLADLEKAVKRRPGGRAVLRLLRKARSAELPDAPSAVRLHEAVLFLRAYPHDRAVRRETEALLSRFGARVEALRRAGADMEPFDRPEVSGIAGTSITTDYSLDVVRWLEARFRRRVHIAWEGQDDTDRLRALLPRFLPMLEEEALEDANVPYLEWLRAAQPDGRRDLAWLLRRIERLPIPESDRAERYEALRAPIAWELGSGRVTRTRMRWRAPGTAFHPGPLIARRDVSLAEMAAAPPLAIRKLSLAEGREVVDMTRGATALRYREYYGFTYADPASVRAARAGRGVEIFFMGLARPRRLPLRAGFAGFIVKNGVPVGYIEGLALFERIEIGFNIYYSFRDGESAWIFGRVLRLANQLFGVTSFSIDPYQLGHENPEAIDSGAFWFYRKLGFRPTSRKIAANVEAEERRIASDPAYRSSPRTLERLVTGNVLYEIDPARAGDWDRFHVRNVGLAVQRRMRRGYGGDAERARRQASKRVSRMIGARTARWSAAEKAAFENFALVLDLVPDLARWSRQERKTLVEIARAKAGREETRYLRLLQRHARLRAALLRLGSITH
ncbi:MAG TPA: hypothetical protein VLG15_16020 [Thermoanaerobaculia bacterium]|nr:hypothetical protein [Thermoanaerobaculia bacterium]